MSRIELRDVEFYYDEPYTPVFRGLSLSLDTSWRTGLVGRNGRGKTTLLRLLEGSLQPRSGSVGMQGLGTVAFPGHAQRKGLPTREVIRESIAPFQDWEERMERLLERGDEPGLSEYSILLERYRRAGGFEMDGLIQRELQLMGMEADLLDRRFDRLSGGERTRILIVSLFLRPEGYALIDEPTNHLDLEGRERLAVYLRRKPGFLLASHDRTLLEGCVDHVLSIHRDTVRLRQGGYAEWRMNRTREEEAEHRRSQKLRREISRLEQAARRRRDGANRKERQKSGAYDRGRVGHLAARQMKRALALERRRRRSIAEKAKLLKDWEKPRRARLHADQPAPLVPVTACALRVELGGRIVLDGMDLTVRRGERVALVGPNGCGKTTLLRILAGELEAAAGQVHLPARLQVSRVHQIPRWRRGLLREALRGEGIDETRFRAILGALEVSGEIFGRPLETFSEGQLKKVELARGLVGATALCLWDEPLNYVDARSREVVEDLILETQPTMVVVEHDRAFLDRIATRIVRWPSGFPEETSS